MKPSEKEVVVMVPAQEYADMESMIERLKAANKSIAEAIRKQAIVVVTRSVVVWEVDRDWLPVKADFANTEAGREAMASAETRLREEIAQELLRDAETLHEGKAKETISKMSLREFIKLRRAARKESEGWA